MLLPHNPVVVEKHYFHLFLISATSAVFLSLHSFHNILKKVLAYLVRENVCVYTVSILVNNVSVGQYDKHMYDTQTQAQQFGADTALCS